MARGTLQGVAMIGAVAVAGVVAYAVFKSAKAVSSAASSAANVPRAIGDAIASTVSDVATAFNPLDRDNVAARAANNVVQQMTGDPYSTVGTKLFEYLNPSAMAAERALFAPSAAVAPDQRALLNGTSFWDEDASPEDYAAAAADYADLEAGNAALAMRGISQGYAFTPPRAIDLWGQNLRGRR